jgi:hypothetical protein
LTESTPLLNTTTSDLQSEEVNDQTENQTPLTVYVDPQDSTTSVGNVNSVDDNTDGNILKEDAGAS